MMPADIKALEAALVCIDGIEKAAFNLPPPNRITPEIVGFCVLARSTINDARAAIASYEAARETGWRSIEAWAVFHEGKPFTITFKAEVANAYAAAGLDVRQLAAAPSPEQEPRP